MELMQTFVESSENGHYQMLFVSKDKQTAQFSCPSTVKYRRLSFISTAWWYFQLYSNNETTILTSKNSGRSFFKHPLDENEFV